MNRTRSSGNALFGVPSAAKVWISPNPFGHFSLVTRGCLGNPLSILQERTILGSFFPFARPEDRRRVEAGEMPPSLLVSAKSGIAHSLRYCSKCASRQESSMGIALWRMCHQLPGVVVCAEHGRPLVEHLGKRQLWSLPGTEESREIDVDSKAEFEALRSVSQAARRIFESAAFDLELLQAKARLVACEGYGVLDVKRLNPRVVQSDWQSSTQARWCQRVQPEQVAFPDLWLTDVLRSRRSERNPMRWAFLAAYFQERGWSRIDAFFTQERNPFDNQLSLWTQMGTIPLTILDAFARAKNSRQVGELLGVNGSTVRHWVRTHRELAVASQHWEWR